MSISFEVQRFMDVKAPPVERPHDRRSADDQPSPRLRRSAEASAEADDGITLLLRRVRSEFLEMPGLRLTPAQGARLWAVDRRTSDRILDGLTVAGFLFRNREGAYLRATVA